MNRDTEYLMRKGLDRPQAHVKNLMPWVGTALKALSNNDIPWQRHGNQALIGPNCEYLAHFEHAKDNPRQRSCIVIRKRGNRINDRNGAVVYTIDNDEDLAFFLLNPKRFLPLIP
jgi:hypothetical protein